MRLKYKGNGIIWGGITSWTLDFYKFGLTVRWPRVMITWANSYPQKGGMLENWCSRIWEFKFL